LITEAAADILSNATGKKIDYVNISEEETREALKETAMDNWDYIRYTGKVMPHKCHLQSKK
jgi:hypothetical protein